MEVSFIGTIKDVSYWDHEDYENEKDLPNWKAAVFLENETGFRIISDSIDYPNGRSLKTDKSYIFSGQLYFFSGPSGIVIDLIEDTPGIDFDKILLRKLSSEPRLKKSGILLLSGQFSDFKILKGRRDKSYIAELRLKNGHDLHLTVFPNLFEKCQNAYEQRKNIHLIVTGFQNSSPEFHIENTVLL